MSAFYIWFSRVRALNATDDQHIQIAFLEDSDSDSESDLEFPNHGGSRPGRAPNINRDFEAGHVQILNDYFSENPKYGPRLFRRRFRMSRRLFLRVISGILEVDSDFEQRVDALGKCGVSTLQKTVSAMRILAYGCSSDAVDEYCHIGPATASEYFYKFCQAVIKRFGTEYLRSPSPDDLHRILQENAKRGFPGMVGSIDCYNWLWKNCPKEYHGSYKGVKGTSIVLEAACSYDLWFWHAFFGMPGALNDINVLQRSPLLQSILNDTAPRVDFLVNGTLYQQPYWLADGIYPNWPVFMKTIPDPQGASRQFFAKMQESCRKDIERAFGVLQARFAIVKNPARSWTKSKLNDIMTTCIILHNMIVEDERVDVSVFDDLDFQPNTMAAQRLQNRQRRERMPDHDITIRHTDRDDLPSSTLAMMIDRLKQTRNTHTYFSLQNDLISHLWNVKAAKQLNL